MNDIDYLELCLKQRKLRNIGIDIFVDKYKVDYYTYKIIFDDETEEKIIYSEPNGGWCTYEEALKVAVEWAETH